MNEKLVVGISSVLIGALGIFTYNMCKAERNIREREATFAERDWPVAERALERIAGEDRIISTQEAREFLDFIGYTKPILDNEVVYLSRGGHRGRPRIEVVIGHDMQNNGGVLRGSSAYSGRVRFAIEPSKLKEYISHKG